MHLGDMNRQRAYRKLLSRSTSGKPSVVEVYENFAFNQMAAQRPRAIPIVKLKIGEPLLASQRRGRSVAEQNNLRSNYNHFCHYRFNGKREFPPIQASTSPVPSPAPMPSRDGTVIFMLRGMQRRSQSQKASVTQLTLKPVPQQQGACPAAPPEQLYAQTTGNQGLSGHVVVKRKDSYTTPLHLQAMSHSQRSMDVVVPTAAPNSASNGIDGCEIRGSSLFKSNTSDLREDDDLSYRPVVLRGASHSFVAAAARQSLKHSCIAPHQHAYHRFVPRPGSYATPRRPRDLFCYENERPGIVYDHREVIHDPPRRTATGNHPVNHPGDQRRVRFDEDQTQAALSPYVFPLDGHGLRVTGNQQPLQLTQKNLEIFDYLHDPKNSTNPPVITAMNDVNPNVQSDKRVLDWLHERQLDMTSCLRNLTSEGSSAAAICSDGGGLPPTPEVNEMNNEKNDSDFDPDLEVYDLTKEEDFLPQDEVIDAIIDDMSCE